jgi:hypothetical protein
VGSLAAALAVLSAAIGGGSYDGRVAADCGHDCVVLLVTADDGRSLTTQSIVSAPCEPAGTSSAFSQQAPRGTRVHSDGSFRWRTTFQVVEGRFSSDGRTVSGTSRFLGLARSDCSSEPTTFSARLVHRAKPDGTCERLAKGRLDVEVVVRRTGCTKATRIVDAWRVDRDCVTTSLELRPCREACRDLGFGRGLQAINVSCAEARSVGRRWVRQDGCAAHACTVADWSCRTLSRRPQPPAWRCRSAHRAVEIRERIVIEG